MSELSAPAGSEGCEARDADAPPQPEQEAERFPDPTEQEPERLSLTGAPVSLSKIPCLKERSSFLQGEYEGAGAPSYGIECLQKAC
ncbi:hypothetical protein, partial [Dysosmobacter sp. HCP28S3_G4]|uniref:hypothetical protein n=1 Tax=Dysosmobacter sp. HCP28S3_G4 TaxID=3438938 RepID=UPI003F8B555B